MRRNTATGWQTIAKTVEQAVNLVPLGYFYHRRDEVGSLLRILTPNMLKLSTNSDQSPKGLFTVLDIGNVTEKVKTTYDLWYKVWVEEYLPILADISKWMLEPPNLQANDVVLFKLTESSMSSDWRLGKIDSSPRVGRDGKVREVEVSYKLSNKPWKIMDKEFTVVTIPAR